MPPVAKAAWWHRSPPLSRDGSYSLEANTGDGWQVVGTPGADLADPSTNQVAFAHLPGSFPVEIQYRVRYLFGNLASDYSPVVTFHWTDTDGDGLPDDWERAWGLDPNNAADANWTLFGDGRVGGQAFDSGYGVK